MSKPPSDDRPKQPVESFVEDDVLYAFLTMDVQGQTQWAERILAEVHQQSQGVTAPWVMPMNFYELTLTTTQAHLKAIDRELSKDATCMALKDFEKAMIEWIAFVAEN